MSKILSWPWNVPLQNATDGSSERVEDLYQIFKERLMKELAAEDSNGVRSTTGHNLVFGRHLPLVERGE